MDNISWGPAFGVLAVGMTFGALLAWRLRSVRPAAAEEEAAAALRELIARRDTLIDQLRELEDTALGRDPAELARQRDELEMKAARVLAELDQKRPSLPAAKAARAATPAAPVPARNAARRGFAWGALSAAAIGGLMVWVSGAAQPRQEGGALTGEVPGGGAGRGPMAQPGPATEEDPEVKALQEQVARAPEDIEARLALAQAHLARRELMKVFEETQAVLTRAPGHPLALAYQALVRLAMGQADEAEKMLKQAMSTAPNLLEPRLHLALVYARTGRMAQADTVLNEAKRLFPRDAQGLAQLQEEMKAQAAAMPMAEDHPPVAADAGGAAPAAGGPQVSGEIELDPARGAAPPGAIVFVTARAVGQTSGPPLAVKRLPASFPLPFTLGAGDSMMGQELPGQLRLEARLDSDGDPLTRTPQDPVARLDTVRLGQAGVHLRLQ
jgi:tetratricopeptide (TPR) repeat protein